MPWSSPFMRSGGGTERRLYAAALAVSDVEANAGYTKLAGRACPYGEFATRWFFQEAFAPGLFDKSINEAAAGLPLLAFHDDLTWPIGHATEWKSEADGLHGVWALDDSDEAQRAAKLAAAGHLAYLSVGYQPILSQWELTSEDAWDPDDAATLDKVTRIEARLLETSTVPVPLFRQAEITMVSSAERTHRGRRHADERSELARWRRWRSSIGA